MTFPLVSEVLTPDGESTGYWLVRGPFGLEVFDSETSANQALDEQSEGEAE